MAKYLLLFVLSASTVLSLVPISECAKKPASAAARKEDIPYIRCQVCEKLASELHRQVQKKQTEISPKKISEYQIIEVTENVCNLKKEVADWILKIDIVERGDKLELVDQEEEGLCNSECKTIERACQEVIGYSDTDLAEYLYTNKPQLDDLVNYLCKDLTKACSTNPPPVPKGRAAGEPFVPKPAKEAEMEKILKSMEGMPGAPSMKMYSRDELMNMQNGGVGEEDNDDEDDDDDEDAKFKANLGNAFREKEKRRVDWKDKITKQMVGAGETLKKQANKVSNRLRQWWKATKSGRSKKSKSSKSEL